MTGFALAFAVLAGLAVLALPEPSEPISGPRVTGASVQACLGSFVESSETVSEYPQRVERVRIVTFCRSDRWYSVIRATAMRVDGRIGQAFSNDREMMCEQARPEPEVRDLAEIVRDHR